MELWQCRVRLSELTLLGITNNLKKLIEVKKIWRDFNKIEKYIKDSSKIIDFITIFWDISVID